MITDSPFGQLMHNLFENFDMAGFSIFASVQNDFLTSMAKFFTIFGELTFLFLLGLFSIILFCFKRTRKISFLLIVSLLIFILINDIIFKPIFCRIRPYNVLQDNVEYFSWYLNVGHIPESPYCFPSGHSTVAFLLTCVLFLWLKNDLKKNWAWLLWLIPICIACSRIYLMVHYPSDVICGSLEGLILGILVWYFTKFVISRTEKSEFWLKWDEKLNFEKFYIKKKGKQISKNVALVIIILFVVLFFAIGFVKFNKSLESAEVCNYSDGNFHCMNKADTPKADENNKELYCPLHEH